jgi:hypothetical protein
MKKTGLTTNDSCSLSESLTIRPEPLTDHSPPVGVADSSVGNLLLDFREEFLLWEVRGRLPALAGFACYNRAPSEPH